MAEAKQIAREQQDYSKHTTVILTLPDPLFFRVSFLTEISSVVWITDEPSNSFDKMRNTLRVDVSRQRKKGKGAAKHRVSLNYIFKYSDTERIEMIMGVILLMSWGLVLPALYYI